MSGWNKKKTKNPVEADADAKQAAYMQNNRANGLQRQTYGYQSPSRSNSEALGRGFREFILPMIVSAAKGWKENYDARGDWKANGEDIYRRWKAGEELNPQEQRTLDIMRQKYPDRFNATAESVQPTQTAPQAQSSALSAAAKMYANNMKSMDFWNQPGYTSAVVNNYPADEAAKILGREVPPLNLMGELLAQEARENWDNAKNGNTEELNNLLRMWR